MFTEGLDQIAVNWIKQGSDVAVEVRSPSMEKSDYKSVPKSPLLCSAGSYMSPHTLPPLKFHSGLLGKHSISTLGLSESDEQSVSNDSDDGGDESIASALYDLDGYYSEKFNQEFSRVDDVDDMRNLSCHGYDEGIMGLPEGSSASDRPHRTLINRALSKIDLKVEGIMGLPEGSSASDRPHRPLINRALSKIDLKVELPKVVRRFNDVRQSEQFMTLDSCCQPLVSSHSFSTQATPIHHCKYYDVADLGTPSAPPVNTARREGCGPEEEGQQGIMFEASDEQSENGEHFDGTKHVLLEEKAGSLENNAMNEQENGPFTVVNENVTTPLCATDVCQPLLGYDTSAQNAWQTMVAYDACVRLCLNAWAKGCPDAPEFLHDECLVLRTAFGLNRFLLHPRGAQTGQCRTSSAVEEACSMKLKKVVGKIRVEVKKLRIIHRRKFKSLHSQQGSFYMRAGTEYVQHVSSLVKTGISSLMSSPLSVRCEEQLPCLFLLKSSTEDSQMDYASAIYLHPGTGDYHDFFPESQGDALLIEVQDTKHNTQGQAVIPILSIAENFNDKARWWPIYHEEHECIGKIQLSIACSITNEGGNGIKGSPVVETLAYDLLLEAAMRAQQFHSRNLCLHGSWKWLLCEFADYYEVSQCYTNLRYLSYIMNVATPTKDCLELVLDLLLPVIKARSDKRLNRQEKSILLECETQVESLLANVFENYKSLDELSPTGMSDSLTTIPDAAPPALAPAVQLYCLLHDILAQDGQTILQKYLQRAAQKRCRRHMLETDEFMPTNSESVLVDPVAITTAYLKMKNLCINISSEILADIKIHNQHILPSSIDLSNIAAAVYSTELSKRLEGFLAGCPPSSPVPHVNELLAATFEFERDLELWKISAVQGGVDWRELFHDYIMVWVQEMQLGFLDLCKAEKVLWSGVITSHSTSPFVENVYLKIKDALTQYETVISRWPQYSLVLENAVADVERAIIKALEKQYSEILAPLKDSIPKKLGMRVQKLARRQSATLYIVPNQVFYLKENDTLHSWSISSNGDHHLEPLGDHQASIKKSANTQEIKEVHMLVQEVINQPIYLLVNSDRIWPGFVHLLSNESQVMLGVFLNTVKRILEVLHCKVEDILKSWASCLPVVADKKLSFGEQMNGIRVLLKTKYKNFMQAVVAKLYADTQASRNTQLKRILEETQDADGEAEVSERMQMLTLQLMESISNLHEVFTSQIFIALCRGFWDRMGQSVLRFLEERKENRVWYKGSYYALGVLDDTFASQMQRLQGNSLLEKDLEPPRSVVEARSILCRDATNGTYQSNYFYF